MVTVSTIIPAYNAERTIARAVESALSQDWDNHEVVVVNDGSTDCTGDILAEYGDRIQVINQANAGLSAARNAAIRTSTGKYLAFLDSDDVWLPRKLKTMVDALERNPSASLAFSDFTLIGDGGNECGHSAFHSLPGINRLLSEQPLPVWSFGRGILPSCWVVPRTEFEKIGGFCERFKGAGGYDDFWVLLLLREVGEFVYVPEALTLYRVGESGKSADKYEAGLRIFLDLVKERFGNSGKDLIRGVKIGQCRSLLAKIVHQMNHADRLGALETAARIAKLRPTYFLSHEFIERLFVPHNLRRLRDLTFSVPSGAKH